MRVNCYAQLCARICEVSYAEENREMENVIYDIALHKLRIVFRRKLKALLRSHFRKQNFGHLIIIRRYVTWFIFITIILGHD
jgi:hypothetical protein